MKKKFKALVLDCDGTLILSQRNALPSPAVTEAVRKASGRLHVGIATQRAIPNTIPIIKHLNLNGPSIVAGGALILDSKTFKIIKEEIIESGSLNKAIEVMKEYKLKYGSPFSIQTEP